MGSKTTLVQNLCISLIPIYLTMKAFRLFLIISAFIFAGCEKTDSDCPDCIKHSIRDFARSHICNSGAKVGKYLFQGNYVYVFSPGTCGADMGAAVYNENCEEIGFLGGIAGNRIINNVDFYQVAVFQKKVWED